ncbi:dihydrolipoamide acetyltransferase component of pyruvate dehydrogenase complex [Ktedonobacteria bacterium brp13]|nr:dihydrolipoamide acetyltransferase component of pyruvate dehydrogenase complex [Ktedonobacteria bacterium brp13]
MTVQFQLPDLGEGITEAEVVRWLVQPGAQVALDQEIVEVQTDKALVALPSPIAGIVSALNVAEGQTILVNTVLLTLEEETRADELNISGTSGISGISDLQVALPALTSTTLKQQNSIEHANGHASNVNGAGSTSSVATVETPRVHMLATPVARRMARELGVDLATVQGTGPAGRIRTADIQRAAAQQQSAPVQPQVPIPVEPLQSMRETTRGEVDRKKQAAGDEEEERIPVRGLRKRIAENMVRSVQTIPQVTSCIEVNASELVALRTALQPEAERQGVKLSYLPFIVKAVVQALRLYPAFNSMFDEKHNEIVRRHAYHMGIATATPDGLLVPVIQHVDRLTLLEIAREVQRLSEQGRARTLQIHELRGSTFTLTNYGSVGGFFSTPIINPGEAAILGLGKIEKRPWVVEDQLAVCPVLPLSLTVDHRLIDGEEAMRFLNTIITLLEQPNRLMLTMR